MEEDILSENRERELQLLKEIQMYEEELTNLNNNEADMSSDESDHGSHLVNQMQSSQMH